MTVQVNHYVIVGSKFPYPKSEEEMDNLEKYTDSAFEEIQHYNGLCALIGEDDFVIVGRVKNKTSTDDFGFSKTIDCSSYEAEREEVTAILNQEGFRDCSVKVYTLTHYRFCESLYTYSL